MRDLSGLVQGGLERGVLDLSYLVLSGLESGFMDGAPPGHLQHESAAYLSRSMKEIQNLKSAIRVESMTMIL